MVARNKLKFISSYYGKPLRESSGTVCIQWNVTLLGGPQTVSSNFLPTASIPTKFSHLFAGKSSCRRRLQIVQPYVLAKVGPGVLRALKRASGPSHLICFRGVSHYPVN